ncbi:TetR/AcrR family transcriptional regulator [Bradyrhizobium sp. LTSPM299]|uniref:TetR/AcrR family transcriptional regulator n=1 Tax=Bradyrhizobium sp. LTSPM299 TaxID=1619233 RepID=UPI000678D67F|nr:TetR/AcrR family transcriptional regulator [Bradyrhizobium sp. LTSPM299]
MAPKLNVKEPLRRTQSDRREAAEGALLQAALSLIANRGVKGTTLAEVGEAAGYSRGIATHYFKTKDGLLQATAKYVHERYASLLAGKKAEPGLETIVQIVELSCTVRSVEAARAMYLMQKEALFDTSGLRDVFKKYNRAALQRIENEIRTGMANGEIRKRINPRAEAATLLALIRGVRAQGVLASEKVNLPKTKRELTEFARRNLAVET